MEARVSKLEQKVSDMEIRLAVTERDVKGIKDDIKSIRDDTKWLRRAFTGALITTGVGAVLGGLIGLVFWVIKGGV
jgi:hypothetical protein